MTTYLATTFNPSFPQIPGYNITEQVYLGSRTIVYRAIETTQQRSVIIKLLRRQYPSFGELVQFRNQYTITKNLPLPGIVNPLSLESFGSGYALVMEDRGAVDLEQYVQKQSLNVVDVLKIGLQIADILHCLYQYRVIHKDIKPANILIHPESKKINLIDFSIASLLPKETQDIQNPNVLEGTLAYIAPEQTGRMNRGIDYRADFYAFGVTFYQLLSGKLPFDSDDPLELVHCHIAKIPVTVDQVNPEVPAIVAAIVAKLMAKNAEDRYQSALGLKHDLELCLTQLKETGKIVKFELGQQDLSDRFLIPEKLYGREVEVQQLLEAFDRVAEGASELMLVAGFSGIGKTAVVNEVHKPIVRQRGYFIKGKFDQFNRNIPLSAFVQALRDLIGQLLCESDIQLAEWRTQILSALGENGQVLIEVIPELEQIIGSQPSVPELSGDAAQNRFNLLLQKFIAIFTTKEHPLVIFLDDLQWADLASLQLIKLLMNDSIYLLMLGAYRDNEVSPAHPFILMVEELKKTQRVVNTITLKPLGFENTNNLIADTLHCSTDLTQPLTELITCKTKGNPFFTTQFLKALHEEGYIKFDYHRRYWQCNLTEIKTLALTDEVVEFMALQLQKLPSETQQVLKLAACIGNQFDLNTLAIVSEQSYTEAATVLWKALQDGLILPTSQVYKFFQSSSEPSNIEETINPQYRFLHDRVQQAAYSLIPEDYKNNTHLKIGQLLLKNTPSTEREERIFEIVNHFNYGLKLIDEQSQRDELAQLNLIAGKKAKISTAYQSAAEYFNKGIQLLEEEKWNTKYDITLMLYEEAAEVAYLNSDCDLMNWLIENIQTNATSLIDKIKAYEIKIVYTIVQAHHLEAIQIAVSVLQNLGIDLPNKPNEITFKKVLEELEKDLQGKTVQDLAVLPVMTDPNYKAAMGLMANIYAAVYVAAPALMPIVTLKMVSLSIRHGNAPESSFAYALYGLLLCGMLDDIELGYQFGKLALNLVNTIENSKIYKAKVCEIFAIHIQHWQEHLNQTSPLLQEGYLSGISTGDTAYAGYCASFYPMHHLHEGQELNQLEQQASIYDDLLAKMNQKIASNYNAIHWQVILNLTKKSENTHIFAGTAFDEHQMIPLYWESHQFTGIGFYAVNKMMICLLLEEYHEGLNAVQDAEKTLDALIGTIYIPLFYFYKNLIHLRAGLSFLDSTPENILEEIKINQAKIKIWATYAPMNYLHKWQLVEAERYRILGAKTEALESYDLAIAGAKENGYIQEEALANELAAKFYLNWNKEKVAAGYMQEAYYCYSRWGATTKVQDLEQRYPQLLVPILQQQPTSLSATKTLFSTSTLTSFQTSATQSSCSGSTSISANLDLATVLKASQTLSSEIQLDKLLATLLHTMLENAGADKAALLMPHQEQWFVEAVAYLDQPAQVESIALTESSEFPHKLIHQIKRSLQPVVIVDARVHPTWSTDDYILQHQPKSILCTPILQQGKLVAILYLENQMTVGVFTRDRVKLLNILCAQAAISLENARLYVQEQEKSQQLQQSLGALKKSEAQFKHLFESSADAILLLDEGVFVNCNQATVEMMRCSDKSEFLSLHPSQLSPEFQPDGQSSFEKANQMIALAFEKGTHRFEWTYRRQDGEDFWVEVLLTVMPYQGKNILHTVWREIGDRKAAEAALVESEAHYRNLFDTSLIGLVLCRMNGELLYANAAYTNILGRTQAELSSLSYWDITPKKYAEAEQLQLQSLEMTGRYGPYEKEYLHKDGHLIPVRLSGVLLERHSETFIWSSVEDISDRKAAENLIQEKNNALENALTQLQTSQAQVVQAEKMSALGNLVAGVAHEINNPLGFLNGSISNAEEYVQDLLEHLTVYQQHHPNTATPVEDHADEIDLEFLREDLPQLLESMKGATDRIKNISTSLRTFSRADTESKIRANLHEGLDSTLLILKYRLQANKYRPEIEVIKNYGNLPEIDCFPGQLNQVFMNILANAIDAFDEGDQQSSFAELKNKPQIITILTDIVQEKTVEIRIRDNGKGMPEDVKNRIFDHLFTTKGVGKGTGLGLSIARKIIIEKHGGQIQVNSTPDQGTEFVILLPNSG